MDFLKKIFNQKKPDDQQEHFVVDDSGNAQEVSNFASKPEPAANQTPIQAPIKNPVNQPVINQPIIEEPTIKEPTLNQNPAPGNNENPIIENTDVPVMNTENFDELMRQAENAVLPTPVEQPVVDPEFQKAKNEIEGEGGIEILSE